MNSLLKKALKAARLAKSRTYLRGLIKGAAAAVEHERALKRGSYATVVDIGANRGQFSLTAARLFPAAEIYAFEPLTGPAATYRRVFAANPRAHLFQAAVAPESGRVDMHVSARDDSSSLLPITPMQDSIFPGTGSIGREQVTMGRLVDFVEPDDIRSPALLKLDVQGYELEALKGCAELLDRFDNIYVEVSFIELYAGQALADDIIGHLRGRGFVIDGVHNPVIDRSGRSVQADFLFARAARRPSDTGDMNPRRHMTPA